jgi:hypothetical protein
VLGESSSVCNTSHPSIALFSLAPTLTRLTLPVLLAGYASDGSRLVAGVVAISLDKRKVLVVESTNRDNHWVLPKGGYETDEATPEDAASRKLMTLFFFLTRLLLFLLREHNQFYFYFSPSQSPRFFSR